MINVLKTIFAVIGLICTTWSVIVSLRLIWEGWKERHEEANDNNAYYPSCDFDDYSD